MQLHIFYMKLYQIICGQQFSLDRNFIDNDGEIARAFWSDTGWTTGSSASMEREEFELTAIKTKSNEHIYQSLAPIHGALRGLAGSAYLSVLHAT